MIEVDQLVLARDANFHPASRRHLKFISRELNDLHCVAIFTSKCRVFEITEANGSKESLYFTKLPSASLELTPSGLSQMQQVGSSLAIGSSLTSMNELRGNEKPWRRRVEFYFCCVTLQWRSSTVRRVKGKPVASKFIFFVYFVYKSLLFL